MKVIVHTVSPAMHDGEIQELTDAVIVQIQANPLLGRTASLPFNDLDESRGILFDLSQKAE